MLTKRAAVIAFFFLFLATFSRGQGYSVKDSSINVFTVCVEYQPQLPFADLKDRFGFSNAVGGALRYKLKTQWELGLSYLFQFGNDVKEDSMLRYLESSSGAIISSAGQFADVPILQRGHAIQFTGGRLLPVLGPNPNSGIMLRLGMGYWTHKVRIEHNNDGVPALAGDYKKGYDRLAGGFMLSQFVGYYHIHNRRLYNFYAGISSWQGFTVPLRSNQFDLMGPEPVQKRLDVVLSLTAGWMIPIYRRSPDEVKFF